MSTRTLVRGGLVAADDEIHADVLIGDGRIAALAAHGEDGFHMIMSDVNGTTLEEMDRLVREGVGSFRSFVWARDQRLVGEREGTAGK